MTSVAPRRGPLVRGIRAAAKQKERRRGSILERALVFATCLLFSGAGMVFYHPLGVGSFAELERGDDSMQAVYICLYALLALPVAKILITWRPRWKGMWIIFGLVLFA